MDEKKESLLNSSVERLYNGLVKENPTFVLLLGMCPTLAVTTSAMNGLGMGLTTMVVLAMSNLMISALRKIIPDKIRIPAFIVIIASFVTIVELLLKAYIPSLYDNLGIYIPLIVVNCIILGRAEAYAYTNPILPSLFDGIGMGMGFSFALTIIGAFRELLGAGEIFGFRIMPDGFVPVSIFVMAPGAFFVLAMLTAMQNKIKDIGEKNGRDMSKIQSGCGHDCSICNKECKVSLIDTATPELRALEDTDSKSKDKNKKDSKAINKNASITEIKTDDNKGIIENINEVEDKQNDSEKIDTKIKTTKIAQTKKDNSKTDADPIELIRKESETGKAQVVASKTDVTEMSIHSNDSEPKGTKSLNQSNNEGYAQATDDISLSTKTKRNTNIKDLVKKSQTSNTKTKDNENSNNKAKKLKALSDVLRGNEEFAEDDEIELLDLNVTKQDSVVTKPKNSRKKSSIAKAQAMLFKAEETLKEEDND